MCVCVCKYTIYVFLNIYVFIEARLWKGTRKYVYVNLCGIRVQIVVHVYEEEGPEEERLGIIYIDASGRS